MVPLSKAMIIDVGQPVDLFIVIFADFIESPLIFGVSSTMSLTDDDFNNWQLKFEVAELIISKGFDSISSSPVGSVTLTSLLDAIYVH